MDLHDDRIRFPPRVADRVHGAGEDATAFHQERLQTVWRRLGETPDSITSIGPIAMLK